MDEIREQHNELSENENFFDMLERFREIRFPLLEIGARELGVTAAELVRMETDAGTVLPSNEWLKLFAEKCQLTSFELLALEALLETARKQFPDARLEIKKAATHTQAQAVPVPTPMPADTAPPTVFWQWIDIQLAAHKTTLYALAKAMTMPCNSLYPRRKQCAAFSLEERRKIQQFFDTFSVKLPKPLKKRKTATPRSAIVQCPPLPEPAPDFLLENLALPEDQNTVFTTQLLALTDMASLLVNTRMQMGRDEEAKLQALHLNALAVDWSLSQVLAALFTSHSHEDMVALSMTKNAVLEMRYAFNAICLVYSVKRMPIDYWVNAKRMLDRYNQLCKLLGVTGQKAQSMSQVVFQFSEAVLQPSATKETIQTLLTDLVRALPQLIRDN